MNISVVLHNGDVVSRSDGFGPIACQSYHEHHFLDKSVKAGSIWTTPSVAISDFIRRRELNDF